MKRKVPRSSRQDGSKPTLPHDSRKRKTVDGPQTRRASAERKLRRKNREQTRRGCSQSKFRVAEVDRKHRGRHRRSDVWETRHRFDDGRPSSKETIVPALLTRPMAESERNGAESREESLRGHARLDSCAQALRAINARSVRVRRLENRRATSVRRHRYDGRRSGSHVRSPFTGRASVDSGSAGESAARTVRRAKRQLAVGWSRRVRCLRATWERQRSGCFW